MSERPHIVGYAQPWSLRAGERLEVMLSADASLEASAALVRLGSGEAAGEDGEELVSELETLRVSPQTTRRGSCILVPATEDSWQPGPFVAAAFCMPTRVGERQALLAQKDGAMRWWLGLDAQGRPLAEAALISTKTTAACIEEPLVEGAWYLVAAGFDPMRGITVAARPLSPGPSWRVAPTRALRPGIAVTPAPLGLPGLLAGTLAIAAAPNDDGWADNFDGKLEAPCLVAGSLDEDLIEMLTADDVPAERLVANWELGTRPHGPDASGTTSVPCRGGGARR